MPRSTTTIASLLVLDITRGFDVLRQVDAVVSQRDPNAAQDVSRAGLVVNGIEGGDKSKVPGWACWSNRLGSRAMKLAFLLPRCSASTRPNSIASCKRSIPTNRLLGNQIASRFNARLRPQPASRTRMLSLSRSSRPGTSGRMWLLAPATLSARCLRP